MRIALFAPDSKLANLAILRIAQYHINKGDNVKWYEPLFDQDIDRLYISKIFTFTDDLIYTPNCEIIKGGTGYDVYSKLPDEIEAITRLDEAYQLLYPNIDYSIMFTTRGCVRHCGFCCVPRKEGMIHDVPLLELNSKGQYIKLLDNNFFASKTWRNRLDILNAYDQPIDFTQGIDIRAVTEEQCEALGKINIKRSIHFAWDSMKDERAVMNGIERLTKYVPAYKLTAYVLVGFENKEITDEDHYRVQRLHELGITPFAMGYIDFNNPKHETSKSVRDFQRWTNKHIHKTVDWNNYRSDYKSVGVR